MSTPPESQKGEKRSPDHRLGDSRAADLALVYELAEPLTALANYLDAAVRLDDADTRAARLKLREILEKSQAQVARADDVLRRLRDLLRQEEGGGA